MYRCVGHLLNNHEGDFHIIAFVIVPCLLELNSHNLFSHTLSPRGLQRERGGKRWWLRESDTPHKAGPSSHVKEFGIYLKEAGAAERTEAGAE